MDFMNINILKSETKLGFVHFKIFKYSQCTAYINLRQKPLNAVGINYRHKLFYSSNTK